MRAARASAAAFAALALLAAAGARAVAEHAPQPGAADERAALQISQAAVGRSLGDYLLRDRTGAPLRLEDLRGRPLVLNLIYTSCYHTCPLMTRNLAAVVAGARDALGEDSFTVVSVGFDTAVDTPQRMDVFARQQGISDTRWLFVSGDEAAMSALTRDIGFTYRPSPKGFDHLAQTTVIDADGVVYRQIYGEAFQPPALVEPLKQLLWGTKAKASSIDGWLTGVRLFCTVYDPAAGRYRFDYSIFIAAIVGAGCLVFLAVFIVRLWRQAGRPRQHA